MNPNQIELVGGHFDGQCHEVDATMMPIHIALPEETHGGRALHWYEIREDGKGYYVKSEPENANGDRP